MEYDQFLLKVHRDGEIEAQRTLLENGSPVMTASNGRLNLDDQSKLLEDIEYNVERLQRGKGDIDEAGLKLLGRDLYQALFPEPVGSFFVEALNTVMRHPDRCLHVSISVDKRCDPVAGWPLEFLRCPIQGGRFLATERPHVTLSRLIDFKQPGFQPIIDPPLKVLVVVSKPKGMDHVMTTALEDIGKWAVKDVDIRLLGLVKDFERVEGIKFLEKPATILNLKEVVTDSRWSPYVLHFMGHGKVENRDGFLAFVPEDGEDANPPVDWVRAEVFAELLSDWHPLMVVLQACESGASTTTTGRAFMSLAETVLQRDVPAVVAMQFEIQNDWANQFAAGLYSALAEGQDIDAAVQRGRSNMLWKSQLYWKVRHFGTPALFLGRPDGNINPMRAVTPALKPRQPIPIPPPASSAMPDDRSSSLLTAAIDLFNKGELELAEGAWQLAKKAKRESMGLPRKQSANQGALLSEPVTRIKRK